MRETQLVTFIKEQDKEVLRQVIRDRDELEERGFIGDSAIRSLAREFITEWLNYPGMDQITMWMELVYTTSLRILYEDAIKDK